MMIIISDSSSLILLAKSNLLEILVNITKILIPQEVYTEVVEEGLKRSYIDALNIANLIKSKKLLVKSVRKSKEFPVTLGKGEKAALELYYQEKANKIIVDDKKVLSICRLLKIPYLTVHAVLVDLLRKSLIDKTHATKSLEILSNEGRYSTGIILHYYEQINEVNQKC